LGHKKLSWKKWGKRSPAELRAIQGRKRTAFKQGNQKTLWGRGGVPDRKNQKFAGNRESSGGYPGEKTDDWSGISTRERNQVYAKCIAPGEGNSIFF